MDYSLTSSDLIVGVKTLGAELCSIKGVSNGVEYVWQANPADWGRHAPILFPIVGKLKGDSYEYKGKTYHLPQHGFARDQPFSLIESTKSKLVFELTSNDKLKLVYPFDFSLSVTYELSGNSLRISYAVKNPGTDPLLYSVGAHPAFRIPVHPKAKRSDYEILFEKEEAVAVHLIDGGLLSGKTEPLALEQNSLAISDSLFDKDALVFKGLASKKLSLAKTGEAPFLNFYFDAPYFGIWSKSATSQFVCLEPWNGIADSVNHNQALKKKEGIRSLAPGATETFGFTVEIAG
ncbi:MULTISPECIES: aldose 1-epimerase family protein [unclassified Imperialibacter]|uniref:aldose 1-epimerase family protein n=1 Tax=unclassified Imperialibacter TaxID=2629706 RepID=UPI001253B9FA|nr:MULTISPECIES: aldose 1-epimerase family protein [unclassified Imperialibacter]CAD5280796.1 Aldose 1-epimerase [Imperialibacter sp. 75]CAD5284322.1 Aldose 1-epimerase [Imperialibacter sp. 89]VVT28446.1 Aldose epimerase [Imperialibacter sp. EC-SDR9]